MVEWIVKRAQGDRARVRRDGRCVYSRQCGTMCCERAQWRGFGIGFDRGGCHEHLSDASSDIVACWALSWRASRPTPSITYGHGRYEYLSDCSRGGARAADWR